MTLNCSNSYILKIFENGYKWFMDNDFERGCDALHVTIVLEFAWKYLETL
jgi:hypothetical protein